MSVDYWQKKAIKHSSEKRLYKKNTQNKHLKQMNA